MFNRTEIKSRAKQVLANKYFKLLVVALALTFCTNGFGNLFKVQGQLGTLSNFNWTKGIYFSFLTYQFSLNQLFTYFAPVLIMFILCGFVVSLLIRIFVFNPLEVGLKDYFSKADEDEEKIQDVLNIFTRGSFKTVVWTMFRKDLEIILFMLLFLIPGILRFYSYYFVPYILAEYPDLTTDEVLEMSKRMTNGIRLDIFILDISFCLWYIPGWFTNGLTNHFVYPYVYQTKAQLYLKMKEERGTIDAEY